MAWSERARAALQAAEVDPHDPESARALPAAVRELQESLYRATGGRGMPHLGTMVWGHASARAAAGDVAPELPDEGVLVAWSPDTGPLYLTPEGALLQPEEGNVAGSAVAEVERAAWRELPWAAETLTVYPPLGERLAAALGVPWREEASDDARLAYANDAYLLIDEDQATQVWANARSKMAPLLGQAQAAGALVEIHSRAPRRASDEDAAAPAGAPAYERVSDSGVRVRIWCADDALVRRVERGERLIAQERYTDEAVLGRGLAPASTILAGALSERALARLDASGLVYDPSLTCSVERLRAELERRGLEVNDALLDLEEQFGGLVIPHPRDPARIGELLFGVYQMLHAPPRLRRRLRFDGEEEPELEPTVWPQMRYQRDVLTLVGLEHFEERLYADGQGAIFRYAGEYDLFQAESGSARAFFELKALRATALATIREIAWLRATAAVGERLAGELGLERVNEVSDQVATHWMGERHWVWQQASYGPNAPATFLVAATAELMVAGAKRMLALASGKAKLALQTSGPGGAARLEALQAAGVPVTS